MDSRYQRKIYQIVHKYHQIVHKLINLQMEQTSEKTVACTIGSALLVDVCCI